MALYFSFSFFYFVLKKIASGVTYMFICIKLNFSRCFCCFVFFLCFFVRYSVTCCLAYSHTHTQFVCFLFSLIFLFCVKKNHHHLRCLFLGPTLYSLVNVLLRSFLRSLAAARLSNSSQSKISSSSSSSSSSNSSSSSA